MSKKIPRWLEKDGKVSLQLDSEQALADGWKEPKGEKPNGEPWNPEAKDGELTQAEAIAYVPAPKAPKPAKVAKQ